MSSVFCCHLLLVLTPLLSLPSSPRDAVTSLPTTPHTHKPGSNSTELWSHSVKKQRDLPRGAEFINTVVPTPSSSPGAASSLPSTAHNIPGSNSTEQWSHTVEQYHDLSSGDGVTTSHTAPATVDIGEEEEEREVRKEGKTRIGSGGSGGWRDNFQCDGNSLERGGRGWTSDLAGWYVVDMHTEKDKKKTYESSPKAVTFQRKITASGGLNPRPSAF